MNDPQTAPLRALQFLLTHAAVQYPEHAAEARGLQAELTMLAQPQTSTIHAVPQPHPAPQPAPAVHAVPQPHPAPAPPAPDAPKE